MKLSDKYKWISEYARTYSRMIKTANPVLLKNFSESIRLIPLIGGFLAANTVDRIEDNNLAIKLEFLDLSCKQLLKKETIYISELSDYNVFKQVLEILAFIKQKGKLTVDDTVSSILSAYFIWSPIQRAFVIPHSNFRFIILAGPSAVGKDTLLYRIIKHYEANNVECDVLTKYTTRKRRAYEHHYSKCKTENAFASLERKGRLIFPFNKRDARYGFDKEHFFIASQNPGLLFAILTDFGVLGALKQYLSAQGIKTSLILIVAEAEELETRSDVRLLPDSEKAERKRSLRKDLAYINSNSDYIRQLFDLFLENNAEIPIPNTVHKAVDFIDSARINLV